MLHVILLILKIIGILLLCILGLLLLILLTVLLVPIRYKVYAEHGEELLLVNARANWLLRLVRVRLTHIEGVLHIWVKVLWFTLFDNLKPRKPKVKKARVKTKEIRKKEISKSNTHITKSKTQIKESKTRITESQKEQVNGIATPKNKKYKEIVTEKKETQINTISAEKEQKQPVVKQKSESEKIESKQLLDKETGTDTTDQTITVKKVTSVREEQSVLIEDKNQDGNSKQKEKINFFRKILIKIKSIQEKIKNFFLGIKNKVTKWFETAGNIKHKIGLISDFIKDKINREGFQITYSSLKKLLKHILPVKLRSRIVFGTGDPCSTGQALGAMSILYSFYGDRVQITPDFENKVFEGRHYARGRIRLVTILIIVIKLILDKRFQQLKRNFQLLKEAL